MEKKELIEETIKLFPEKDLIVKDGVAYCKQTIGAVTRVIPVRSQTMFTILRQKVREALEQRLPQKLIDEVVEELEAIAYENPIYIDEFALRVGLDKMSGSVVVDVADESGTLLVLEDGNVKLVTSEDTYHHVLFRKPPQVLPMVMPDLSQDWLGGVKRLKPYINCSSSELMMLISYITYLLAHPKAAGVPYPIFIIQAEKGSGKSFTTNIVLRGLVDPNINSSLSFPRSEKDLAIHANSTYLLQYDNMRTITKAQSDNLCKMATGSNIAARKLYTDDGMASLTLHSALVLNSIHPCVKEPDLADRCLRIMLKKMQDEDRRTEKDLKACWEQDLPVIFGCLLKLAALLLQAEPEAKAAPAQSARIMDFSVWLAAFEQVAGLTPESLQKAYKNNVKAISASGVENDSLTVALEKLIAKDCQVKPWKGSPSDLLYRLQQLESCSYLPRSPASLSIKLKGYEASLNASGIYFEIGRAKERFIRVSGKPLN